ncbi:MAG: GDP-mannose 4,6-dehydratase [Chloroflexota bacterium]
MARRVLITGGTGFVGRYLCEFYQSQDWEVHSVARHKAPISPHAHAHSVDLTNGRDVERLIMEVKPEIVQHLAAQSSVEESRRDPYGTWLTNVSGQFHVLEAVRRHAQKATVVVVGSSDEYGNVSPDDNPVTEAHPLLPVNPYALSKVAQDLMGYQYAANFDMRVVRVRPFLQIGPRRSAQFVMGSFARQVVRIADHQQEPRIEVGNIDLMRDFTDVRDVARALALVASEGEPAAVYNIASGEGHSLREMLHEMLRQTGIEAEIHALPELLRHGEMPLLVGDAALLRGRTSWRPQISLEQSIADTLEDWGRVERGEAVTTS